MRHVIRHWTEIRYCEFPDDAPVHDEEALAEWIDQHPQARGDREYLFIYVKIECNKSSSS